MNRFSSEFGLIVYFEIVILQSLRLGIVQIICLPYPVKPRFIKKGLKLTRSNSPLFFSQIPES